MATLLQIAQLGNPILRKKAQLVTHIGDLKIQNLIENLVDTVKDSGGVGIAAPQVYQSLRIIIVASFPNVRYPHAPKMSPTPMINPLIIATNNQIIKDWEGCLSIPGIRGLVPRKTQITIEYFDKKGNKKQKTFSQFVARIIQHEVDHLDGIVFLDRLNSMRDIITDKEYQKMLKKKS